MLKKGFRRRLMRVGINGHKVRFVILGGDIKYTFIVIEDLCRALKTPVSIRTQMVSYFRQKSPWDIPVINIKGTEHEIITYDLAAFFHEHIDSAAFSSYYRLACALRKKLGLITDHDEMET